MGKHSKIRRHHHHQRWPQVAPPRGMTEMVDGRTGRKHLLALDAAAAGQQDTRQYWALCGVDILPAALVDPGIGYCWPCTRASK
jgi:hypothetical protein